MDMVLDRRCAEAGGSASSSPRASGCPLWVGAVRQWGPGEGRLHVQPPSTPAARTERQPPGVADNDIRYRAGAASSIAGSPALRSMAEGCSARDLPRCWTARAGCRRRAAGRPEVATTTTYSADSGASHGVDVRSREASRPSAFAALHSPSCGWSSDRRDLAVAVRRGQALEVSGIAADDYSTIGLDRRSHEVGVG